MNTLGTPINPPPSAIDTTSSISLTKNTIKIVHHSYFNPVINPQILNIKNKPIMKTIYPSNIPIVESLNFSGVVIFMAHIISNGVPGMNIASPSITIYNAAIDNIIATIKTPWGLVFIICSLYKF